MFMSRVASSGIWKLSGKPEGKCDLESKLFDELRCRAEGCTGVLVVAGGACCPVCVALSSDGFCGDGVGAVEFEALREGSATAVAWGMNIRNVRLNAKPLEYVSLSTYLLQ